MKVALLSTNDVTGGAAAVTLRLTHALRHEGVDATMVAENIASATPDPCVAPAGHRRRYKAAFLAERLGIFLANRGNRADLFKADTASHGLPLWRHPVVEAADVVVLNWINQGFMSLDGIRRIAAEKPVVWTMHDMWSMTGICHHAGECRGFRSHCGNCPLLGRGAAPHDLSFKTWRRKKALYGHGDIHFVAISRWLAEKANESALLRRQEISLIPNAFPTGRYSRAELPGRDALGVPHGKTILMAAARLDDPVKGLPLAVDALNRLHATPQGKDVTAIFVGALRDPGALSALRLPHIVHGPEASPVRMAALMAHADVVLSSSHYETLPTTLIEGQEGGAVPVAFDHGGQRDIIDHGVTGFLATYPDTEALARNLALALTSGISADTLRASVGAKFSSEAVARRYIALFHKLLTSQSNRII